MQPKKYISSLEFTSLIPTKSDFSLSISVFCFTLYPIIGSLHSRPDVEDISFILIFSWSLAFRRSERENIYLRIILLKIPSCLLLLGLPWMPLMQWFTITYWIICCGLASGLSAVRERFSSEVQESALDLYPFIYPQKKPGK